MDKISHFVVFLSIVSSTLGAVDITVDGLKVEIKNDNVLLKFKENAQAALVSVNGTNILNKDGAHSWYLDWSQDRQRVFIPTSLHIVEQTTSRVHFYWLQENINDTFTAELHYIMEEGLSGVYSYAKLINDKAFYVGVGETRIVYRYDNDILTQGTNQVFTGTPPNKYDTQGAVHVQDATDRLANGTYFTKYDYATYIRKMSYHGLYGNGYGTFIISPSREYHGGGAMKQDLSVHNLATESNYFASGHFGTPGLHSPPGWKHIYGPFLIYFPIGNNDDMEPTVRRQVEIEESKWPYTFVNDPEYPLARGSVSGYVSGQTKAEVVVYDSVNEPYDGQQLGYLFTNETDSNGHFVINKVRPGTYRVVAYPLAGQGCEILAEANITVTAESLTQINLTLPEPENIIWSLGEVNRRSSEFKYADQSRNYKWQFYPPETTFFTIGVSDPASDWYYAQSANGTDGSHWYIGYNDTYDGKSRTLRVALAACSMFSTTEVTHLVIKLNDKEIAEWDEENDHAIYRSAMQSGRYRYHLVTVAAELVQDGENILEFWKTQGEVMYDAISLQRN